MDNFSQETTDEKELLQDSEISQEGEDIEFDEDFDIEKIQQNLQKQMEGIFKEEGEKEEEKEEENQEVESNDETKSTDINEKIDENDEMIVFDEFEKNTEAIFSQGGQVESIQEMNFEKTLPMFMQSIPVEINPEAKKYVIYINPENIEFIESLSIDERKQLINKILREQDGSLKKQREIEKRSKFVKHVVTSCLTAVIGFPLVFFMVNKSIELTMLNYKESQQNFINLYKNKEKMHPRNKERIKEIKF